MAMNDTVMVVEDDSILLSLLKQMLRSQGFEVVPAHSAEEGLAELSNAHADLILTDIHLPGMDGIRLTQALRASDRYQTTPIVLMTGAGDDDLLEEAFKAGCDDYIPKPFSATVLRTRLSNHLDKMKYLRRLQRIRRNLKRFVSVRTSEIAELFSETDEPPAPELRDISICFTDIRGFTALSEQLDPQTLFSSLNDHIADQVKIIHEHGGYIDKFAGDGLMAIFDGPNRIVESCLCALDILKSAQDGTGAASIRQLGLGIHAGRAVVGSIGFTERLDYTAIGSTVNLAARLCGYATPMSIIVSEAVQQAIGVNHRMRFDDRGKVMLRGNREPVGIYSLYAID